MRISELSARSCNELALMPTEDLTHLPAVLACIERESFLGAVSAAYPQFIRCALESIDVPDHEGLNLKHQLFILASKYATGEIS